MNQPMLILRRVLLLTGLLAVIAGIFGMHVMSPGHVMPPPAAGHHSHSGAQSASPDAAVAVMAVAVAVETASTTATPCAISGGCPTMATGDAACVLSPANTSLSAPLPGTTPFPALNVTGAALATATYSYLPGSPSPGELCISRT